jgi:hypothetical protein
MGWGERRGEGDGDFLEKVSFATELDFGLDS